MPKHIELTDLEIHALSREELRVVAEEYLYLGPYSTHREIFSIAVTSDVVGNPRIMAAYAELLRAIREDNYRDPVTVESTGYQVTVKGWQSDDYIRSALISTRNYCVKQAAKEAETE